MPKVDIYEHEAHTTYLQAWFKEADRRPSQAMIADRIGCSKGLLSGVVAGRTRLADKWRDPLVRALRLADDEADYFHLMVDAAQTPSDETRHALESRRRGITAFRTSESIVEATCQSISQWYHAAIAELAWKSDFRADAAWIAERLRPPISMAQAQEAIDTLFAVGRLKRSGATVLPGDIAWVTHHHEANDHISDAARKFHRQMSNLTADALDRFPQEERYISGMTVSIPRSMVPELEREIQRFQQTLIRMCAEHIHEAEDVFYLGLQMFPLSDTRPTP